MKHRRSQSFKRHYEVLPIEVREQAKKAFKLFAENMSHPSLAIERVEGYPGVWSGRINKNVRWTFHFEADPETGERICVHRTIGNHEDIYRNP